MKKGFTIVELLIVIVVIGILAAITLVSYNGIQNRAKQSAAQSATSQASKKLQTYFLTNADTYPPDLATVGITNSGDTTFQYSYNNSVNPKTYCITATTNTISYYQNNTTQPSPAPGGCPGHGVGGVAAVTNYAPNPRVATNINYFYAQTPTGNITSRSVADGPSGEDTYTVLTTNAGQLRINFRQSAPVISVTPGEQINISMYLYAPQAITTVGFEVQFNTGWVLFNFGDVSTGWNRYSVVAVVPSGASTLSTAQLLSTGSVSASTTFKATKFMVTKGNSLYEYADGSSPNWVWNGTPNASTSTGPPL